MLCAECCWHTNWCLAQKEKKSKFHTCVCAKFEDVAAKSCRNYQLISGHISIEVDLTSSVTILTSSIQVVQEKSQITIPLRPVNDLEGFSSLFSVQIICTKINFLSIFTQTANIMLGDRLQVHLSKLSHSEQTRQPITMVAQNEHHVCRPQQQHQQQWLTHPPSASLSTNDKSNALKGHFLVSLIRCATVPPTS